MKLPLEEVAARTRSVAREFSQVLEATHVVAADGEADHVEVLVTIAGCDEPPCTVLVNVPRDDGTFEASLRARIREALSQHAADRVN